jgi:hypothetical protein
LPDQFPAAVTPFGESPGRRLCRGIAISLNEVFMVDCAPRGHPAGSLFYRISGGPEFVFHFVFHDAASSTRNQNHYQMQVSCPLRTLDARQLTWMRQGLFRMGRCVGPH